jgi:hypothetical protein
VVYAEAKREGIIMIIPGSKVKVSPDDFGDEWYDEDTNLVIVQPFKPGDILEVSAVSIKNDKPILWFVGHGEPYDDKSACYLLHNNGNNNFEEIFE